MNEKQLIDMLENLQGTSKRRTVNAPNPDLSLRERVAATPEGKPYPYDEEVVLRSPFVMKLMTWEVTLRENNPGLAEALRVAITILDNAGL